jgi:hypothetical protein
MTTYQWKFLDLFAKDGKLAGVRYLITATEGSNNVQSEGNHTFSEGIVNLPFEQIKEENLIDWLEKDTTHNEVNAIKLNLQNQLKNLDISLKVDFPWLAGTFTPQV